MTATPPGTDPRDRRLLPCGGLIFAFVTAATFPLAGQTGGDLEMLETVTAYGQGNTRAQNTLNLEDLETALPGIDPTKAIDILPGVNVSNRDPFGFYEFGNDIRLRAFSVAQIAVTVDGVPMGSNSARYGTPSGRVIDNENISAIDVNQGAGDLATPAYEALGGSIKYRVRKPAKEFGVLFSYTAGEFDNQRFFGRVDTGEIFKGFTAYVSYSDFKFKTMGVPDDSLRTHVDLVTNYEIEGVGNISFQYSYNNRDDFDTQGLRWDRWQALETGVAPITALQTSVDSVADIFAVNGYINYNGTDSYLNGAGTPVRLGTRSDAQFVIGDLTDQGRFYGPPTDLPPDLAAGDPLPSNYYNLWRNGRLDYFYRLVYDFELLDKKLKWSGNTYYQDKENYGWFGVQASVAEAEVRAGYSFDPNRTDIWPVLLYNSAGQPIDRAGFVVTEFSSNHAVVAPGYTAPAPGAAFTGAAGVPGRTGRDEDFGGHRYGFFNSFRYDVTETVQLHTGLWYEYDRHAANRPNYNLTNSGSVLGGFNYDQFLFNNYFRSFETDTLQFWLEGSLELLDEKLKIVGGFKGLKVERSLSGVLTNQQWRENDFQNRSVTYEEEFLPQLGLLYEATDTLEFFANYSENLSAPNHDTMTGGSDFNASLQPEFSTNIDVGLRYSGKSFNISVAAFSITYEDRVLAIQLPPEQTVGLAGSTQYSNVGGLDSVGFEVGYEWRTPVKGLKLVGAFAYQDTTFTDDLQDGSLASPINNEFQFTSTTPNSSGRYDRTYRTAGKSLGNTPEITFVTDANYSWKDWFFKFGGKYYSSVYVNTLNTEELPEYYIFNAAVTWKGAKGTKMEPLSVSLGIDNVFDEYIWYARTYNSAERGTVVADQGRNIYMTAKVSF